MREFLADDLRGAGAFVDGNTSDHVWLGMRSGWNDDHPFGLGIDERRRHVHVIGQTGTGKSTLLLNSIVQDIQNGRGVGLIDPHGSLAQDVLDRIPASRIDDVIYFDPSSKKPLALNLFRANSAEWPLVASGIVSAFKKIWGDSWGPRLEYVLYATLAALLHCDNASLLGVSRMLYDDHYRAWVVRQVKDPMVASFWNNEFSRYDKSFQQETIGPIQNKIGQLFLNPALRNILGQVETTIHFRSIMDRRHIFIANLSKGKIGEIHSILLGSLLTTGFEVAALSRADISEDERKDFFLYVDEFQNCATESFASILSEARKYRLCLTLAHQYFDQLPDAVCKAVFGNVGSMISFRASEADSSVLERQFGGGYSRSRFTGLANFELCARLLHQEPFVAKGFPQYQMGKSHREKILRRSRQKYNTKRRVVEGRIERWLSREY